MHHFPVCLTLPLCGLFHLFLLCCLSLPFIMAILCMAAGGKSSGFMMRLCNERRHGDSAVSPHRLHLFLFLCALYICLCHYQSSFLLSSPLLYLCLSIEDLFCSFCLSASAYLPLHILYKYNSKEIIFHRELLPMPHIQGFCLL